MYHRAKTINGGDKVIVGGSQGVMASFSILSHNVFTARPRVTDTA